MWNCKIAMANSEMKSWYPAVTQRAAAHESSFPVKLKNHWV
jgi:hypothetical protein